MTLMFKLLTFFNQYEKDYPFLSGVYIFYIQCIL